MLDGSGRVVVAKPSLLVVQIVVVLEYDVTVDSLVGVSLVVEGSPRLIEQRSGEAAFVFAAEVCLSVCVDDGGAREGAVMPSSGLPWLLLIGRVVLCGWASSTVTVLLRCGAMLPVV